MMVKMKPDLITREGWHKLDEELKFLWKHKRPEVTQAVREAAALGDRSENAEYKEGKRQLREIDKRIHFLMKRLDALQIVDYQPTQAGRVFFGAYVALKNAQGEYVCYRIVGADEIQAHSGYISIHSPMAKSLIGKQAGDEVSVHTPKGEQVWWVEKISYQPFDT